MNDLFWPLLGTNMSVFCGWKKWSIQLVIYR
jgi:hypothetical protein